MTLIITSKAMLPSPWATSANAHYPDWLLAVPVRTGFSQKSWARAEGVSWEVCLYPAATAAGRSSHYPLSEFLIDQAMGKEKGIFDSTPKEGASINTWTQRSALRTDARGDGTRCPCYSLSPGHFSWVFSCALLASLHNWDFHICITGNSL